MSFSLLHCNQVMRTLLFQPFKISCNFSVAYQGHVLKIFQRPIKRYILHHQGLNLNIIILFIFINYFVQIIFIYLISIDSDVKIHHVSVYFSLNFYSLHIVLYYCIILYCTSWIPHFRGASMSQTYPHWKWSENIRASVTQDLVASIQHSQ